MDYTPAQYWEALHAFEKLFGVSNPLRNGESLQDYYIRQGLLYSHYDQLGCGGQVRGFLRGYFGEEPVISQLNLMDRIGIVFSKVRQERLEALMEGYAVGIKAKKILGIED